MRPLCSIVIPTYNREKLFLESFFSAISQTYRPIEIIIVNDGSTDGTEFLKEILIAEAESSGVKVKWLFQENKGVSTARNYGMRHCHGKYILFHDSDDLLDKKRVELQIEMLEMLQADMCAASKNRFNEKGEVLSKYSPDVNPGIILSDIDVKKIHWGTQIFMYRHSAIEGIWWDEKISSGEDKDFNFRALLTGLKVCCEPKALTYVREHNYDERLKYSKNSMEMYLSVHLKMISYYRENCLSDLMALEQARMLRTVYFLYKNGNKKYASNLFRIIRPLAGNSSRSILERFFLSINSCSLFCMARRINIKAGKIIDMIKA
jgi:glycosyltransferase involved in cell wall biosynthesis